MLFSLAYLKALFSILNMDIPPPSMFVKLLIAKVSYYVPYGYHAHQFIYKPGVIMYFSLLLYCSSYICANTPSRLSKVAVKATLSKFSALISEEISLRGSSALV